MSGAASPRLGSRRRRWGALALLLAVAGGAIAPGSALAASSTIDDLAGSCPSPTEVAALKADFSLSIEAPVSTRVVCGRSPNFLNRSQVRIYQSLRAIKAMTFSRPLPWTSQSLYGWLSSAITGIRVRNDISLSYCCDPPHVINLKADVVDRGDFRNWTDLQLLLNLIVHEARHADGVTHTCNSGADDSNWGEKGSWAVEAWLTRWEGLFGGSFLDAPAAVGRAFNREGSLDSSTKTFAPRVCSPDANLGVTATSPAVAQAGSQVTYASQVHNSGPDAAPATMVSQETLDGLTFQSVSASQGNCLTPTATNGGPAVCLLGTVANGAGASVSFTYDVTAPTNSLIGGKGLGAPRAIAEAADPTGAEATVTPLFVDGLVPILGIADPQVKKSKHGFRVHTGQAVACPPGAMPCRGKAALSRKAGSTGDIEVTQGKTKELGIGPLAQGGQAASQARAPAHDRDDHAQCGARGQPGHDARAQAEAARGLSARGRSSSARTSRRARAARSRRRRGPCCAARSRRRRRGSQGPAAAARGAACRRW